MHTVNVKTLPFHLLSQEYHVLNIRQVWTTDTVLNSVLIIKTIYALFNSTAAYNFTKQKAMS